MESSHISEVRAQIAAAIQAGDADLATELTKTIPLTPEVAFGAARVLGVDYLKNAGFDLSAAEKVYGPEWGSQKP